ncbi:MAG: CDGSH iron-sulfur domain-containing protein [Enterobacterales bacterium]|nr:CDGSH iron-sulfur domain-containing protein [Enterobacterales bacterium]
MDIPKIAAKQPVSVELEEGKTYYYCTCGESSKQPFCDGSHSGTSFTPKAFEAERTGTHFLCACKRSNIQPICDGNHSFL